MARRMCTDGEEGDGGDGEEADSEEDAADDVYIPETEVAEPVVISDDSDDSAGEGSEPASTTTASGSSAAKRQHIATLEISPELEAELAAFDVYRAAPLNHSRKGVAVAPETRKSDRKRILRFMAWLNQTFKFKVPPTLGVFAHSQVGAAAQRYIKELVEKHGRISMAMSPTWQPHWLPLPVL